MFGLGKKKEKKSQSLLEEALAGYELPSFSAGVIRTLQDLRDPKSSPEQIAKSIQANPALVVKIFRTVNSAAYGLMRPVSSVSHAVTLLGRARIESLIVALAVREQLPTPTNGTFCNTRFWSAAARRAALARSIAELLEPQSQSEAFVAGLLQDMAIPLLATIRRDEYSPVLEHWYNDSNAQLDQLEQSEFGWDHPAIGASMAELWDLPEPLVLAIGNHHAKNGHENGVGMAVQLVGHIRESEEDPGVDELVEVCRSSYGLPPDVVCGRIEAAFAEAEELAALMC